jgi:hypothetical protein
MMREAVVLELFKEGSIRSVDKSSGVKSINSLGRVKIEVVKVVDMCSLKDLHQKVGMRIKKVRKICIFVIKDM